MSKPRRTKAEIERDTERIQQMSLTLHERADEYRDEGCNAALRILKAYGDTYLGAIAVLRAEFTRRGWKGVTE